ncbi:MAG: SCO family protein [Bacteroidia bacterium]|nr:SCO family protein [Bacteroidia bacterium]MCX7652180.1 SCO family protein [Bacteroidia bacterium]MDW8416442.1 SCO family protein [Bacteroidia bacterium]
MKGWQRALIASLVFVLPFVIWLVLSTGKNHYKQLPKYGPHQITPTGDTIWHTLPKFSLLTQDSVVFTSDSLRGRIHVADYFFTRCPGICPRLSHSMAKLQDFLRDKAFSVKLVSYTVDPEHDTPATLREYAERYQADPRLWTFVTGPETTLYRLATQGYLIPVDKGPDTSKGELGYIHSDMLVLVDPQLRIRGFYSGLDSAQVRKLMDDINILLLENRPRS